jgi:hypothetical protein
MKTILLATLLFAAFCTQAQQAPDHSKNHNLKLTVVVDPGTASILIDSSGLFGNNASVYRSWEYNQSYKAPVYTYDSLAAGTYTFYTRDFWAEERRREVQLKKDTLIILPATRYKQADQLSLADLQAADTIKMRYKAIGCFHSALEDILLIKNKNQESYTLIITDKESHATDRADKVPASVISDLYAALLATQSVTANGTSTSQQLFWVLAGNKLFYFHDIEGSWRGYPYHNSRYIKRS